MLLLEIEENWYWFLVFAGGFGIISTIVLIREFRRDDDAILQISPLKVLRNIFVSQLAFYALYLYVAFTIRLLVGEIFWPLEPFTSIEPGFYTKRGISSMFSLVIGMASVAFPLTACLQTYKNMLDYCFTVFILHFVVVSIVEQDFPVNGAWWAAAAAGLIASMSFSERLSYHLETMSYQSSLSAAKLKSPKPSNEETELPELAETDEMLASKSQDFTNSSMVDEEKGTEVIKKQRKDSINSDDSKKSNNSKVPLESLNGGVPLEEHKSSKKKSPETKRKNGDSNKKNRRNTNQIMSDEVKGSSEESETTDEEEEEKKKKKKEKRKQKEEKEVESEEETS